MPHSIPFDSNLVYFLFFCFGSSLITVFLCVQQRKFWYTIMVKMLHDSGVHCKLLYLYTVFFPPPLSLSLSLSLFLSSGGGGGGEQPICLWCQCSSIPVIISGIIYNQWEKGYWTVTRYPFFTIHIIIKRCSQVIAGDGGAVVYRFCCFPAVYLLLSHATNFLSPPTAIHSSHQTALRWARSCIQVHTWQPICT